MPPLYRKLPAFALLLFLTGAAGAQDFNLSQDSLNFSAQPGFSPPAQTITLFNLTGNSIKISVSTSTQSGGSWLSAHIKPNPVPGNGQATITVTVSSSTLPANNYSGTVTVSDSNTSVDVPVSLTVSGVVISAPSSENITLTQGTTGMVTVHVTGGPSPLQVTSTVNWLITGSSGQAPGDISVTVDASTLSVGVHSGGISLQCSGGSPCLAQFVSITATVNASSSLRVNIGLLSFQAYQGRMDPAFQSFQITTSNGSPLSVALTGSSNWLTFTTSGSTASSQPVVAKIGVDASQLSLGANSGTLTVNTTNGSPPIVIPVMATLSPFSISVMPASPLAVSVASGKTQIVALQLATADLEPAALAVAAQTNDKGAWLQAPATASAPATFNITVDASQLIQGNYSGSLTLSCTDATCAPVTEAINVTVTVGTIAPVLNAVVGGGLSVPPVDSLSQDGLLTLFGTGFADASVSRNVTGSDLMNNALPTNLANTCVQGGNAQWGLIYVSATQINAVADPAATSGTVPVSVIRNCGQPDAAASAPVNVNVAAETPQFLFVVQNPSGKNEVVAIEALSGAKVGPVGLIPGVTFAPASAGDILTAYGVGWGTTIPAAVVGSLAPGAADITGDHTLTVGGKTATVSYAGLSPTFAGLYQINFTVPSGLSAGNQPIVLTIDGVTTPIGAYLAVK